jgi:hypothetical protein
MGTTPTAEFLTKLERRRDGARATCESFLMERRDEGREELSEGEALRYAHMLSDLNTLEDRCQEYRRDLERVGGVPALGTQRRAIGSAGALAPLHFPQGELRRAFDAARRGEPCEIRSAPYPGMEQRFTSADSLLPAELFPFPIEFQHEWRLLDRLPGYSFDRPSIEFIQHISTTGTATSVPEGGLKPEVTLNTQQLTLPAAKLAASMTLSREILDDWSQFTQYATAELYKIVCDEENLQLLTGDGSGTDMTGFYNTEGVLSYNAAGDTAPDTTLDSIEKAIQQMRSGSALAEPDLAIFSPEDWSTIRRIKDGYQRFMLAPDPSNDEVNTLWGIPVLVTTQNPVGRALLIDSRKFGQVAVRSPLAMFLGYSGTDFQQNLIRYNAEERLVLTVTRPAAVLEIIGLPAPTTTGAEATKSTRSSRTGK